MFVVFDYDGVVLNSLPAVHRATTDLFALLSLDAPSQSDSKRWLGPSINESIVRTLEEHSIVDGDVAALTAFYFDHVISASCELLSAFPGMVSLLNDLQTSGVTVGIATMKARTEIDLLGGHLPGLDDVQAWVAPDDHHGGTNKKVLVGELIGLLNIDPTEQGWMIGDRASDIEAGHAHGLTTIGVLWGAGSRKELSMAEHLCADESELRALLMPARV